MLQVHYIILNFDYNHYQIGNTPKKPKLCFWFKIIIITMEFHISLFLFSIFNTYQNLPSCYTI
jgi:hypothetical protein